MAGGKKLPDQKNAFGAEALFPSREQAAPFSYPEKKHAV
jgi:hypothetical protein